MMSAVYRLQHISSFITFHYSSYKPCFSSYPSSHPSRPQMQHVLGIEAARSMIASEIKFIMTAYGITVDRRHLMLLSGEHHVSLSSSLPSFLFSSFAFFLPSSLPPFLPFFLSHSFLSPLSTFSLPLHALFSPISSFSPSYSPLPLPLLLLISSLFFVRLVMISMTVT